MNIDLSFLEHLKSLLEKGNHIEGVWARETYVEDDKGLSTIDYYVVGQNGNVINHVGHHISDKKLLPQDRGNLYNAMNHYRQDFSNINRWKDEIAF